MLTLSGWICCANVQAAEVEEPFRVMILRSNSQYLPAAILQDRGMREAFTTPGTRNVEFSSRQWICCGLIARRSNRSSCRFFERSTGTAK